MEIIATITESDVYKEREITPKESYRPLRKASRVVLFDEHNNVALHYYSTKAGISIEHNIDVPKKEEKHEKNELIVNEVNPSLMQISYSN